MWGRGLTLIGVIILTLPQHHFSPYLVLSPPPSWLQALPEPYLTLTCFPHSTHMSWTFSSCLQLHPIANSPSPGSYPSLSPPVSMDACSWCPWVVGERCCTSAWWWIFLLEPSPSPTDASCTIYSSRILIPPEKVTVSHRRGTRRALKPATIHHGGRHAVEGFRGTAPGLMAWNAALSPSNLLWRVGTDANCSSLCLCEGREEDARGRREVFNGGFGRKAVERKRGRSSSCCSTVLSLLARSHHVFQPLLRAARLLLCTTPWSKALPPAGSGCLVAMSHLPLLATPSFHNQDGFEIPLPVP